MAIQRINRTIIVEANHNIPTQMIVDLSKISQEHESLQPGTSTSAKDKLLKQVILRIDPWQ